VHKYALNTVTSLCLDATLTYNARMTETIHTLPQLVLASSSPYRKKLLQRLQLPFTTLSPDIDETPQKNEPPVDYVKRLARGKAQAGSACSKTANTLFIGSDQTLVLDGDILGKPGNTECAYAMLSRCSGKSVFFYCGYCLWHSEQGELATGMVPTEVRFRELNHTEIARYIEREPALDCAGAFKSETLGISLFSALRSDDPTALVGLPLISIAMALRTFGLQIP